MKAPQAPTIQRDFEQAKQFLDALSGEPGRPHTFQTFDDSDSKCASLIRVMHGRLEDLCSELAYLNDEGAGIFVTINKTDGRGRRAENIVSVRALFIDKDKGALPQLKVTPSAVVQSAHGPHVYWFLRSGEALAQFTTAQMVLIQHLDSDPVVKDLSRVMRVPGFFHLKDRGKPFMVTMTALNEHRYTIQQVLTAYPPTDTRIGSIKSIDQWRDLIASGAKKGTRNHSVASLAGHLLRKFVDPFVVLDLVQAWNRQKNEPPLSDLEVERTINSIAGKEIARRQQRGFGNS